MNENSSLLKQRNNIKKNYNDDNSESSLFKNDNFNGEYFNEKKKYDDKQEQAGSLFSSSILFSNSNSTDSAASSSSSSSTTIENLLWLLAAIILIYVSDIFNVILYDQKIYRQLMMVGFGFISINIAIAIYLIVWLSFIKKISSDRWTEMHPTFIPIATACFVIGSLLLTIAIWPVYSFLAAPILFTIFMGFIVILINLPLW